MEGGVKCLVNMTAGAGEGGCWEGGGSGKIGWWVGKEFKA